MEEILIIAEHDGTQLDPVTQDLIAWGRQIATVKGWQLGVLAAGSKLDSVFDELKSLPVDAVYMLDDPALAMYTASVYVPAIGAALREAPPRLVLIGHTYTGIELGGGLAARLPAIHWSNCRSVKVADDGYVVSRPVCGGSYESVLEIEEARCVVLTLQRGSSPAGAPPARSAPRIVRLSLPEGAAPGRVKTTGETSATFTEDITKADMIVAVGRGIGQQDRLETYRELARALGGSIAASRPLVDLGWLPVDYQVGISGRTVQPKVYLACGISGSMQHLAGMRDSRMIIAINEDPNAPIFQYAHFGVVGDVNQIVPALIEQAKTSGLQKANMTDTVP